MMMHHSLLFINNLQDFECTVGFPVTEQHEYVYQRLYICLDSLLWGGEEYALRVYSSDLDKTPTK